MKKAFLLCLFILSIQWLQAQAATASLQKAFAKLQSDPALKHASLSLYVMDAKTGKTVFDKNGETGLAPASCQKIFTSIAALELLGPGYQYKTKIGYDGKIEQGILQGSLHIIGSGDPSLGSWRWSETKEDAVLAQIASALERAGVQKISGDVLIEDGRFSIQPIPGGWIWDDIGNYYGAGSWGINWHENQYDLEFKAGSKAGDPTSILSVKPPLLIPPLLNQVTTGDKGSGDNSYIYLPPYADFGYTEGTIPAGEDRFTISGSFPYGPAYFAEAFKTVLSDRHIGLQGKIRTHLGDRLQTSVWPAMSTELFTLNSPRLDSLNYWFLKKSINLYGEIFIKTIAAEKTGTGSTEKGVESVVGFWKAHGIEPAALNIIDGSGLSPQNRVTTHALVSALQYAKRASWFGAFYDALPEINHMKMKSGSIGGARSFAGYQTSHHGNAYIFAIIANNYDGSSQEMVKKMWRLLDLLK